MVQCTAACAGSTTTSPEHTHYLSPRRPVVPPNAQGRCATTAVLTILLLVLNCPHPRLATLRPQRDDSPARDLPSGACPRASSCFIRHHVPAVCRSGGRNLCSSFLPAAVLWYRTVEGGLESSQRWAPRGDSPPRPSDHEGRNSASHFLRLQGLVGRVTTVVCTLSPLFPPIHPTGPEEGAKGGRHRRN